MTYSDIAGTLTTVTNVTTVPTNIILYFGLLTKRINSWIGNELAVASLTHNFEFLDNQV